MKETPKVSTQRPRSRPGGASAGALPPAQAAAPAAACCGAVVASAFSFQVASKAGLADRALERQEAAGERRMRPVRGQLDPGRFADRRERQLAGADQLDRHLHRERSARADPGVVDGDMEAAAVRRVAGAGQDRELALPSTRTVALRTPRESPSASSTCGALAAQARAGMLGPRYQRRAVRPARGSGRLHHVAVDLEDAAVARLERRPGRSTSGRPARRPASRRGARSRPSFPCPRPGPPPRSRCSRAAGSGRAPSGCRRGWRRRWPRPRAAGLRARRRCSETICSAITSASRTKTIATILPRSGKARRRNGKGHVGLRTRWGCRDDGGASRRRCEANVKTADPVPSFAPGRRMRRPRAHVDRPRPQRPQPQPARHARAAGLRRADPRRRRGALPERRRGERLDGRLPAEQPRGPADRLDPRGRARPCRRHGGGRGVQRRRLHPHLGGAARRDQGGRRCR